MLTVCGAFRAQGYRLSGKTEHGLNKILAAGGSVANSVGVNTVYICVNMLPGARGGGRVRGADTHTHHTRGEEVSYTLPRSDHITADLCVRPWTGGGFDVYEMAMADDTEGNLANDFKFLKKELGSSGNLPEEFVMLLDKRESVIEFKSAIDSGACPLSVYASPAHASHIPPRGPCSSAAYRVAL